MKNTETGNENQQNQENQPNSGGTRQKSPKHPKRETKRQLRQGQEGNSQTGHQQQQRREVQQPSQTQSQQRQRWQQGQERQQNRQTNQQVEMQRSNAIGGGESGGHRANRQYFNQNQQQQRYRWQQRGRGFIGRGVAGTKAKERMDHAGVKMTGQVSDCSICYQHSDLFGLGDCIHPICMECALRIRVFGESRQCPHCRAEIPILNFVSAPPGQQLLLRLPRQTIDQPEHQRKFGVMFESQYALDCFNAYMANRCNECAKRGKQTEFGAFSELRAHLAQAHELSFCHICCENLNVLIKDRRVYSRDELQQHMNGKLVGEQEGFRGHPTCQFCEERFYDDEQQYKHLRKEHYYCQFCDQDGREQNVFYRNQHQLNKHNSRCHHPCVDPECLQMGICFRTDVELDVHKAKQHHRWLYQSGGNSGPSRSGTIPLDIQFTHSRGGVIGQNRQQNAPRLEIDENMANSESDQQTRQQSQIVRIVPSAQNQQQSVQIVRPPSMLNSINSNTDFPNLPAPPLTNHQYGAPPGWTDHQSHHLQTRPYQPNPIHSANSNRSIPSLNSRDQFPSLGGNSSKVLGQQNTIWGQKSTKELFAPRPSGEASKKLEESKRPKFIPSPECWPEHMLEKLKAREEGKPDPDPIQVPSLSNPPKKEKKRKTKTVPLASAANRLATGMGLDFVPSSSSKFNTLAAYDEMEESTSAGKSTTNWWSGGQQPPSIRAHIKLTPSTDDPDFVRIQLPGDQRRQIDKQQRNEQQQKALIGDEEEEKNSTFSLGPPPGFGFEEVQKEDQNESEENDWEAQNKDEDTPKSAEKSSFPIDLPSPNSPPGPSNSGGGSIVHLTMRSIATAIFGGGGEGDDKKGKEEENGKKKHELE